METSVPMSIQSAMADAVQALRSLVGEGAGGGHPGLASIQRQLDELRLRALRVEDVVVRPRGGDPRMFKAELDVPTVLIDSGATNILRQPRDPHELHDANQVSVVLANNERTQLAGSILTPSTTTQPLLPMGDNAGDEDGDIGGPPTDEGVVDDAQEEREDAAFRAKFNFGKGASKGGSTLVESKKQLCLQVCS